MTTLKKQIISGINWFLKIIGIKKIIKNIYFSEFIQRFATGVTPETTKKDQAIFIDSQVLNQFEDIRSTLLYEAKDYFNLSEEAILKKIAGEDVIIKEWNRNDRSSKECIEEFYENESYFFADVLKSKLNGMGFLGLRKVIGSFELALKLQNNLGNTYLDYGCGIGVTPILFGKHNFDISIADISSLMLGFSGHRLKNRNIDFRTFNLREISLPQNFFSFVTCFDVLEHAYNPIEIMVQIRNSLKLGGIVFVYFAYGFNPNNPTHIVYNDNRINDIKKLGFKELSKDRDKIMRERNDFFIFMKT